MVTRGVRFMRSRIAGRRLLALGMGLAVVVGSPGGRVRGAEPVEATSATGRLVRPDATRWPDLFAWTDTCNVYVLREGESALLIDGGDGSVIEHLHPLGVQRIEWVLFTHHHREQLQGATRFRRAGARFGGPEAERRLFENPTELRRMNVRLEDPFTIHGASYVRPPIQPVLLDRAFKTNEVFRWRGYELVCLSTPGNSPGGMTYVLRDGGSELAFSGDVMLAGSRMHTWFDTEWDYGFAAGIQALRRSANLLAGANLAALFPSHGPVVLQPGAELREYETKLAGFEKLYVRGYDLGEKSVDYQDRVSQPTIVSNVWQVSPHLFKFKRPNFWPNFGLILADSGRALVVDCGLTDEAFLETALNGMREHLGLKAIDALIVSHMHGDHFLDAPYLRETWGAKVWALENMVDKMEHPGRFDYAAPVQAYGKKLKDGTFLSGVSVDRAFRPGESFTWEGYRFTVDWMPGQTEFALCLHGMIDGRLVAFTGDNLFGDPQNLEHTGHEAMVAHNSAILEEGYIHGAEFLKRLQPDLLVGGHSFVMDRPAEFIERFRRWSYQMRDAFRDITAESDYRYAFDPFWVRAEPYRIVLRPGEDAEVQIHVRNFRNRPQRHRIEVHAPPGLTAAPAILEGELNAEARGSFAVRLEAARGLAPAVRLVALDVSVDGRRYGEWFDLVVGVEEPGSSGR